MKPFICLSLMFLLTACGKQDAQQHSGASVTSIPTIIAVFDPCGDKPVVTDETLVIMSNGQVFVNIPTTVSGYAAHLLLLAPGAYRTNDLDKCYFSVGADGMIFGESHHN